MGSAAGDRHPDKRRLTTGHSMQGRIGGRVLLARGRQAVDPISQQNCPRPTVKLAQASRWAAEHLRISQQGMSSIVCLR